MSSELDPVLAEVLKVLNATKTRATYGAVASVAKCGAQAVGGRLGRKRIEASWVVNSDSGMPTGYEPELLHPELLSTTAIIRTGAMLQRLIDAHRATK